MKRFALALLTLLALSLYGAVVTPPVGFSYTPPFDIYETDGVFSADPAFNIQTRANITVTTTYYLNTVSGLDTNSGLTTLLPLKTWNAVIAKGDYDRIIIQNGSRLIRAESSSVPTRSVEVIGEGTVYFTSERNNDLVGFCKICTATYAYGSLTGGRYIATIRDDNTMDEITKPKRYISRTTTAQVEATAGSYLWANGVLLVHPVNNLTPSGQSGIRYYDSSAVYWIKDNLVFYFENINFRGGVTVNNATAAGTATKLYMKDCTGHNLIIKGVAEAILQRCNFYTSADDAVAYDALHGVITKAVELDCRFEDSGTDTTNQASTLHSGCYCISINSEYQYMTGQCVADADATSERWMLGCDMKSSDTGIGAYTAGKMWLDTCTTTAITAYDLQNIIGATTYTHNFTGSKGVNDIGGTLTPY